MTSRALKGQKVAAREPKTIDHTRLSHTPIVAHCNTCQANYTAEEWARLQAGGAQNVEADDEGPALTLELRHCVCGSTLAIEWKAP